MTPPSGREPARPQTSSAAAAQPRLSREAVVAFVLLPVLLAAGFFLGTSLLGGDSDPSIDAAATATQSPDAALESEPPVQGPGAGEQSPAAGPSAPEAPVVGPTAPAEEAPSASPEAPSPEPTQPSPEAPSPEAPSPEPTQPSPAPTAPSSPSSPPTTGAQAAPAPSAGESVLLFRGFAGEDVRTWQARMAERGWIIAVDGIFGPQSESVAERFQAEKGLAVDGIVGIQTWNASWDAPITRS